MMMMHSNNREEIDEAFAGDIVALAGMKETTTGDTLCDPLKSVVLETMSFPNPVIEIAVEPKSKNDQEKMSTGLARLAAEDPSFQVSTDIESGQTIMKGMGELHLDILIDRLKREFKVEANIGAPQVAYRETITKEVEVDYTHKKQSGGSGQFARVKMTFSPNPVIEIAVEPKSKNDQEKMSTGLARLAAEDPSFQVSTDIESGQTIMKGMGELHLDILIDRLKREFKVEANIGAPQVAYRETITKEVEVDYTHKKQSGGSGQFARVKMTFSPNPDKDFEFLNSIKGGNIPTEYIPGVEKGLMQAKDAGIIAGFPAIDFKVNL